MEGSWEHWDMKWHVSLELVAELVCERDYPAWN